MRKSGLSDKDSAGNPMDLKGRFVAVCQHLCYIRTLAKAGDLSAIKATLTAKAGSVSFGALNGYIHNYFQKPSPDDLRTLDSAIPFFTAIYGAHK